MKLVRKTASTILAANLKKLMEAHPDRDSQPKVARATKGAADQTTVGRALRRSHSTTLRTLDGLAAAFDVPAWTLLFPDLDPVHRPAIPSEEDIEAEVHRRVIDELITILPEAKALILPKDEETTGTASSRDTSVAGEAAQAERDRAAKAKKRR